jgi:hypothetical protein
VSRESVWAEARVAHRFVEELGALSQTDRHPALAPVLDRDPYLSAWTNVEAALGSAAPEDQEALRRFMERLDGQIDRVDMCTSLREAARRAVRALLARRWLLTEESLTFVYEPFERVIPLASLGT